MNANVTIQVENASGSVQRFSFLTGYSRAFKLGGIQFTVGREAVEAKAPLKLEVDKWYKRRDGKTVQIVSCAPEKSYGHVSPYRYRDSDGHCYAVTGATSALNAPQPFDLLEEVPAPLKLEVGRWYKQRDGKRVVKILRQSEGGLCAGDYFNRTYFSDGRWSLAIVDSDLDLIEEVPAPNTEKPMGGGGMAGTLNATTVFVDWGGEKAPAPIKLELGKRYLRRDGTVVRILEYSARAQGSTILPERFTCEHGHKYAPNGTYAHSEKTDLDIVAEAPQERRAEGMRPFVVGDLVTLKSGGPKMTIVRADTATAWVCAYSEDAKIIHKTFPPAALVHTK
jgi:uncharacterized protein YodC (DUF2158 family)